MPRTISQGNKSTLGTQGRGRGPQAQRRQRCPPKYAE